MISSYTVLIGIVFCLPFLAAGQMTMSPVVNTDDGKFVGHLVEVGESHDSVYEFTGIQYATIGERFSKPKRKSSKRTFYATELPSQCPQLKSVSIIEKFYVPVTEQEECLFLNVWVPKTHLEKQNRPNKPDPLPVFFWIHGGGFLSGSASLILYNGTVMSSRQNIIFVAVQYRLGAFGFSYLGNTDVPGNLGMWDQNEALKWVYDNIRKFGGDPSKITIAGESAGAASVAHHLLSKHSRPYIHQAIIESASAISPWAAMTPAEAIDKTDMMLPKLAQLTRPFLRCNDNETTSSKLGLIRCLNKAKKAHESCLNASSQSATVEQKVACLKAAEPNELLKVQLFTVEIDWFTLTPGVMELPWAVVIDGDFLERDPKTMLKEGDFTKVPLLIGSNKDEGSLLLPASAMGAVLFPSMSNPNRTLETLTHETYHKLVQSYFTYYPINGQHSDELLKEAIEMQYWRGDDDDTRQQPTMSGELVGEQVKNMLGDFAIICPVISWADEFAKYTDVYHYHFTHRAPKSPYPEFLGVCHGDELPGVLGDALNENEPFSEFTTEGVYQPVDKILSKRGLQYWTNFVKFGNPNTVDFKLNIEQLTLPQWPVYESYYGDVLEIKDDGSKQMLLPALKSRDCKFWYDDIPALYERLLYAPSPIYPANPTCPPYY